MDRWAAPLSNGLEVEHGIGNGLDGVGVGFELGPLDVLEAKDAGGIRGARCGCDRFRFARCYLLLISSRLYFLVPWRLLAGVISTGEWPARRTVSGRLGPTGNTRL